MTMAMHAPFKDSAIAYNEVLQYLRTRSIGTAQSVSEVYFAVRNHPKVRGIQQVTDALKSLHSKGQIRRVREGRKYAYWGALDLGTKPEVADVLAQSRGVAHSTPQPQPQPKADKPEVTVTDTSIIINHAKCKITIEF